MAPKTPSHTTQTTEVKLPEWVEKASEDNYELAKTIAQRPLVQYQGTTVADPSKMTTDAYKLLTSNVGANDKLFQDAYGALGESYGNANAMYGNAAGLLKQASGPLDIKKYLNPYTAEVEKNAMSNLERSRETSLMKNSDAAIAAGAFGGGRHGVVDAITNAEAAREAGDLSAQLRKQGFDTATATALADMERLRNAAAGYTSTGQTIANTGANTASGLLDTAKGRQASVMQDVMGLLSAGGQEQAQRQKLIDADMAKFYERRDYPLEGLNTRLAALGMSPYGKTESTERTGQQGSSGTDWAMAGLGFLQALPGLATLFSDEREKVDKKKLGKDPVTGLDMYAYRYKGDPKSYPKVVGPMAQDIEKVAPHMVSEIGGHKVVKGMLANG